MGKHWGWSGGRWSRAMGEVGNIGKNLFLVSMEGLGEEGNKDLRLACLNNFSQLWGTAVAYCVDPGSDQEHSEPECEGSQKEVAGM